MNTGRYSLKQLLNNNEIEQIIIPEIQRDYVWEKQNVEGLLTSIYKNYQKKENTELTITDNRGYNIDKGAKQFLLNEYSRLQYNTQIGFIYAYHDRDFSGKFFLIDGQQRLTTLYLLLLALYVKANKADDFRSLYFKEKTLKLDYKVREISHDYMVDFVDFTLDGNTDFSGSFNFYNVYEKDITTNALYNNYSAIINFLEDKELTDFIDYVENYVEFNYFDTNLSEQGEQLYLYMNSRGESLSYQEIIKSTLISRSENKLSAGTNWENWQNFFWKHRGNNSNADLGFQEFLKIATIIQICTADDVILKSSEQKGQVMQSKTEVKEDYIRVEKEDSEKDWKQRGWLKGYQLENNGFDISYLVTVFAAIKRIEDLSLIDKPYFSSNWLSSITYTIDYVAICGILYFITRNPNATDNDIHRLGMYLQNIRYYEQNRKNPDSTVIVALEQIKLLCDRGNFDIIGFLENKAPDRFVSGTDRKILEIYSTDERDEWELLLWSIIIDDGFNSFIAGNCEFIFNFMEGTGIDEFRKYYELLKDKIYSHKDITTLRRDLLRFCEMYVHDGGGSSNLGDYIARVQLVTGDSEYKNWQEVLARYKDGIKEYLNYASPICQKQVPNDWRRPFIIEPSVMDYMKQYKFLWSDDDRIVLLEEHQAGKNKSRELQIQLFHAKLSGSWVFQYDTCVYEFDFLNGKIVQGQKDDKNFYIDIQYIWKQNGGSWFLILAHRKNQVTKDSLKRYWDVSNMEETEDHKFRIPLFTDQKECSIQENVEYALKEFNNFIDINN
jgi:uncharacterized protein with ParB-like and HNH nuclease domain